MNTWFGVLLFLLTILIISGCNWYQDDLIRYEEYLCTIDTTGQNFQYLLKSENFSQFVVPPDNSKILIFQSDAIYSLDLDGSNYQLYSQCPESLKFGQNLSWAVTPEGFRIIWCYADDIFTYDYNNDEFTQVTYTPDIYENNCTFSCDGTHIIYCTNILPDTTSFYIYSIDTSINMMNYDYSNQICIIEEQQDDRNLSISLFSNNRIIYYISGSDSITGIYSISLDGTDNTNLYNDIITTRQRFVAIEEENSIIFTDSYNLYKLNYENGDLIELTAGEKPRLSGSKTHITYYKGFLEIMDTDGSDHRVLKDGHMRTIYQPPVFYQNDTKILFEMEKEI